MIGRLLRVVLGLGLGVMGVGVLGDEGEEGLESYGLFGEEIRRAGEGVRVVTELPLELGRGTRVALIGNTLFDLMVEHGQFEALLHQGHPGMELVVRNLAWSADEIGLRPRPANFGDLWQHLTWVGADVVLAAYGFNESFAGEEGLEEFRAGLRDFVRELGGKEYGGRGEGPRVVLVGPIANEDVAAVAAGERNNGRIGLYSAAMAAVAAAEGIGFVDLYGPSLALMAAQGDGAGLTRNGVHLTEVGYGLVARELYTALVGRDAPRLDREVLAAVEDKGRQFFRRYRPLNTAYYVGGRRKDYGYLDFLPAMRNFDLMVAERERHIWALVAGEESEIDDSGLPELPEVVQARGANRWLSPADELASFDVDPRFEVSLFASEEQFPELAAPVQMRWDGRGRLWVSCSTTYPHVYPGQEAADRIIILEDTSGDGRADRCSVFAEGLHVPLSFEFGDGGVYVSEQPHLTFLKDEDGDGVADLREIVLTGFGCEDSHHSLHDFVWTPCGELLFRESIFHHSQVETAYGAVRQRDSGWFQLATREGRLRSFGSYPSTNPWGVTFDRWGQHVASHPIYAAAFHALDPPYPTQHVRPAGLAAYSGTCGHEFIDVPGWPEELAGRYVKARYKPTHKIEIHRWVETEFGYEEEYEGDLMYSRDLCFIPVDLRHGPDGALYVCDWYNPVKGHMQYALRDERRDRESGRIWRIEPVGFERLAVIDLEALGVDELVAQLGREEGRVRYLVRRELRGRDAAEVAGALDRWLAGLEEGGEEWRRLQLEALWCYRGIGEVRVGLMRELLGCEVAQARAAAMRQLRYWHGELGEGEAEVALARGAVDVSGLVRMEAAIAASYVGSQGAFGALLDAMGQPHGAHLSYALRTALDSAPMAEWRGRAGEGDKGRIAAFLAAYEDAVKERPGPPPSAEELAFDGRDGLLRVVVSCVPERLSFDRVEIRVLAGQPVRLELDNPDATPHNLVLVVPGAADEVGLLANAMAADPAAVADGQFLPDTDKILQASVMVGPGGRDVMRFEAPLEAGEYPYLCTFPGHWVVMRGVLIVDEGQEKSGGGGG
jgi:azurin